MKLSKILLKKHSDTPQAPDLSGDLEGLPPLNAAPSSFNFVFHNKLPKSGSTTMKYIISTLQKANNFHMDYQAPCINKATCATDPGDGIGAEKTLAEHVQERIHIEKTHGTKY